MSRDKMVDGAGISKQFQEASQLEFKNHNSRSQISELSNWPNPKIFKNGSNSLIFGHTRPRFHSPPLVHKFEKLLFSFKHFSLDICLKSKWKKLDRVHWKKLEKCIPVIVGHIVPTPPWLIGLRVIVSHTLLFFLEIWFLRVIVLHKLLFFLEKWGLLIIYQTIVYKIMTLYFCEGWLSSPDYIRCQWHFYQRVLKAFWCFTNQGRPQRGKVEKRERENSPSEWWWRQKKGHRNPKQSRRKNISQHIYSFVFK